MLITIPEPSNTNFIWTKVPLQETLIMRGRIPPACISSLTIYGPPNSYALPNSTELQPNINEEFQNFELEISHNESSVPNAQDVKIILDSRDWEYGMLVMRNYLVTPGTAMYTPEIIRKSDHKVLRTAQKIISGPAHLQLQPFDDSKVTHLINLHGIVWLINAICFHSPDYMLTSNILLSCSTIVVVHLLRQLFFLIGKKRLKKALECLQKPNQFKHTSFELVSKDFQPSKFHQYWVMRLDIPKHRSLSITGKIHRGNQKYWSVVVYDEYGIPLSQYQHHDNTYKTYTSDDQQEYTYDIRLTNAKVSGPNNEQGMTEIDVSMVGKGCVLFRIVHPVQDRSMDILEYSRPQVTLL